MNKELRRREKEREGEETVHMYLVECAAMRLKKLKQM